MKLFLWAILALVVAAGIFFATRGNVSLEQSARPASGADVDKSIELTSESFRTSHPGELQTSDNFSQANLNQNRASIDERIESLAEAGAKSDSNSFQIIINGLNDEAKEIRKAALDAAIQFGSRDAIPLLQDLAARTDDAREKVEILDAIEFLELPPLSEVRGAVRTNSNRNSSAPK